MNDNKTIQPKDDKTETDYQPEVSKIAKRGKNQNLFIFLIIWKIRIIKKNLNQ